VNDASRKDRGAAVSARMVELEAWLRGVFVPWRATNHDAVTVNGEIVGYFQVPHHAELACNAVSALPDLIAEIRELRGMVSSLIRERDALKRTVGELVAARKTGDKTRDVPADDPYRIHDPTVRWVVWNLYSMAAKRIGFATGDVAQFSHAFQFESAREQAIQLKELARDVADQAFAALTIDHAANVFMEAIEPDITLPEGK